MEGKRNREREEGFSFVSSDVARQSIFSFFSVVVVEHRVLNLLFQSLSLSNTSTYPESLARARDEQLVDLGDVGARGEAHGVVGRGHGSSLHLRNSKAVALLLLLLGGVVLVVHVGHWRRRRSEQLCSFCSGASWKAAAEEGKNKQKQVVTPDATKSKKTTTTRSEKEERSLSSSLFLLFSLFLPSPSVAMSSSNPPRVNPIDRPLPKGKAEVNEGRRRG